MSLSAEVLESFMATREAMQVQQNVTVYESFGTSTLPSSMESPVSPERELDPKQQREKQRESEESLGFPAACHLVVSRCLYLLLGIRPACVEPSVRENSEAVNTGARLVSNRQLCLRGTFCSCFCSALVCCCLFLVGCCCTELLLLSRF